MQHVLPLPPHRAPLWFCFFSNVEKMFKILGDLENESFLFFGVFWLNFATVTSQNSEHYQPRAVFVEKGSKCRIIQSLNGYPLFPV